MFEKLTNKLKLHLIDSTEKATIKIRKISEGRLRKEVSSGATDDDIEKLLKESYFKYHTQEELEKIINDEKKKLNNKFKGV